MERYCQDIVLRNEEKRRFLGLGIHFRQFTFTAASPILLGRSFSLGVVGDPPWGRTENLLIKSQASFVHRRVQQATIDTNLRLKAKSVPTGQK
jgi:hypothetical protein